MAHGCSFLQGLAGMAQRTRLCFWLKHKWSIWSVCFVKRQVLKITTCLWGSQWKIIRNSVLTSLWGQFIWWKEYYRYLLLSSGTHLGCSPSFLVIGGLTPWISDAPQAALDIVTKWMSFHHWQDELNYEKKIFSCFYSTNRLSKFEPGISDLNITKYYVTCHFGAEFRILYCSTKMTVIWTCSSKPYKIIVYVTIVPGIEKSWGRLNILMWRVSMWTVGMFASEFLHLCCLRKL